MLAGFRHAAKPRDAIEAPFIIFLQHTSVPNDSSDLPMKMILQTVCALGILVVVLILAATAIPAVFGGELHGVVLLAHMGASGALVVLLPVMTLLFFMRAVTTVEEPSLFRFGYWLTVIAGFATVATVFYCMLPILSTSQMRQVMFWHGVAGFALVAGSALFGLIVWNSRKIQRIPVRR